MANVATQRSTTGVIFGLFLAAMGALITAGNLDLLPFQPALLDFLPLLLAVVALDRLLAGLPSRAAVLLAVAVVAGWLRFHPDPEFGIRDVIRLWPLLIVLFGVMTVLRAFGRGEKPVEKRADGGELAFFSNLRQVVRDQSYRGGSLFAMLGGHHLDLRAARLSDDGAVLQIFAFWGGIEIVVPEGWGVRMEVNAVLAGADDKTTSRLQIPGAPGLVVRGLVVMGGVEIHH